MSSVLITQEYLTNIANAIRSKNGSSNTYTVGQMSSAISDLSPTLQQKTNISPALSSQTITYDDGYDGLSSVQINAMPTGSATTPATTITTNPTITLNDTTGLVTVTTSTSASITPTISSGYVSAGTAGTITVNGSNTMQLSTIGATTITPTSTAQVITGKKFLTGDITISPRYGYTFLNSETFTVSTTSTSAASIGSIACGTDAFVSGKILYVRVKDTAGPRAGYFFGSDTYFFNINAANSSTSTLTSKIIRSHYYTSDSTYGGSSSTSGYGIYGYSVSSAGNVSIRRRYNSSYSLTIDSTYLCQVYLLDWPDGVSMFS